MEALFELLFKYRPVVFERGSLGFAWPVSWIVLVPLALVAALAGAWFYPRSRGELTARDRQHGQGGHGGGQRRAKVRRRHDSTGDTGEERDRDRGTRMQAHEPGPCKNGPQSRGDERRATGSLLAAMVVKSATDWPARDRNIFGRNL